MPKNKPAASHKLKTSFFHRLSDTPRFNLIIMAAVVVGLVVLGYYLIVTRAASQNLFLEAKPRWGGG